MLIDTPRVRRVSATSPSKSAKRCLQISVFIIFCTFATPATGQMAGMIEFVSAGKRQQGLALVELAHEMVVLGRDGSIRSIDPNDKSNVHRPRQTYTPIEMPELRNQLRAEFGPHYEVVTTKNYLVVQPKGRGERWPRLFEQSHRSFKAFMTKRGVKVREGRFPLVAVVYPDETAMQRAFRNEKIDMSRVAGIYFNETNRIMTHDGGQLSQIASTVRHEAAHQSAFNSGVHSRVADTPKWITEGIGQLFETAAMTQNQSASRVPDRVNAESMYLIKKDLSGVNEVHFHKAVMRLLSDDIMFDSDREVYKAYAVSWAMMFYLAERQPREFARLLNYTAKRPAFRGYERADRLKDFEQIAGHNPLEFSNRVRRFLETL